MICYSKPLVFISGPYRNRNPKLIEENILNIAKISFAVRKAGVIAIAPALELHPLISVEEVSSMPNEFWLNQCLEMIRPCDGIIFLPNWKTSDGACREKIQADTLKIPKFYTEKISIKQEDLPENFLDWIGNNVKRKSIPVEKW